MKKDEYKMSQQVDTTDYKQKYKEALSRARDLHDNHPYGQPQTWMICEKIFPELRESEDEKTRKAILELVKQSSHILNPMNQKSMIAWLEKQGEQKTEENKGNLGGISSNWSEEEEMFLFNITKDLEKKEVNIKEWKEKLLDLARKELQPEFDKEMDKMLAETDKVVYQKGKQDALKSLPKWKKATEHKEFEVHVCVMDEDMYPFLDTEVNEGEYYIELSDLKTLPKEE